MVCGDVYTARSAGRIARAYSELDRLAEEIGLRRSVLDVAKRIYRDALQAGVLLGRSVPILAAACLYAACRKSNAPITLNEICTASTAHSSAIASCYREMLIEMGLKMPAADYSAYVDRIAIKTRIPIRTRKTALNILRRARKAEIHGGKNPICLAASALYLASQLKGQPKHQKEIASAAGITEVTIRNRCRELRSKLNIPASSLR